jgi:hypothetical protein
MGSLVDSGSRELLTLAVALAVMLAEGKGEEQIGRMAAFFTVLGDVLALLALQPENQACCQLSSATEEEQTDAAAAQS